MFLSVCGALRLDLYIGWKRFFHLLHSFISLQFFAISLSREQKLFSTLVTYLLLFWWSIYFYLNRESRFCSPHVYFLPPFLLCFFFVLLSTKERFCVSLPASLFHDEISFVSLLFTLNLLASFSLQQLMNKKLMLMNQIFNYFNRCSQFPLSHSQNLICSQHENNFYFHLFSCGVESS